MEEEETKVNRVDEITQMIVDLLIKELPTTNPENIVKMLDALSRATAMTIQIFIIKDLRPSTIESICWHITKRLMALEDLHEG